MPHIPIHITNYKNTDNKIITMNNNLIQVVMCHQRYNETILYTLYVGILVYL